MARVSSLYPKGCAMHRSIRRRLVPMAAAVTALLGFGAILGSPALAHPLGNFTTNAALAVVARPDAVEAEYVLDLAEIPALQARQGQGAQSDEAFAAQNCATAETHTLQDGADLSTDNGSTQRAQSRWGARRSGAARASEHRDCSCFFVSLHSQLLFPKQSERSRCATVPSMRTDGHASLRLCAFALFALGRCSSASSRSASCRSASCRSASCRCLSQLCTQT